MNTEMLERKRESAASKKQAKLYTENATVKYWLDKNRGEKSRAAFLEDFALNFDKVLEKKREKETIELLRSLLPAARVEDWLLKKLYGTCRKCGKPKIPGKDMFELGDDVIYIIKKCCLCIK